MCLKCQLFKSQYHTHDLAVVLNISMVVKICGQITTMHNSTLDCAILLKCENFTTLGLGGFCLSGYIYLQNQDKVINRFVALVEVMLW